MRCHSDCVEGFGVGGVHPANGSRDRLGGGDGGGGGTVGVIGFAIAAGGFGGSGMLNTSSFEGPAGAKE